MFNYSFWADEAAISAISKALVNGQFSFLNALGAPGVAYQKLQMLLIAVSFKFFGISEFTARLPSMASYLLGIVVIFFLTKKLSDAFGGMLSAFVFATSWLNLSYATQAKPYQLIQLLLLIALFVLNEIVHEKRLTRLFFYHSIILIILTLATFVHNIGVFLWIIYGVFLLLHFSRKGVLNSIDILKKSKYSYLFLFFASVIIFFPLRELINIIIISLGKEDFFHYNNIYQVVKLFGYKYSILSVTALFGFIWSYKKNRQINLAILIYSLILLIFACFVTYIFNIRYVLTLFGLIFFYFGIFWSMVGKRYFPKKPWITPLVVIIILYMTGYKIVRFPHSYYNPNIDKYGDVQIANYKDFYSRLKRQFPNYKSLFIANDTFDAENWYMDRYSNVYFMKFTNKPYKHKIADVMVYGSLDDFKRIIKNNSKGLLIVEDWQSFMPDDIKLYARNNLKLVFRVYSLKEAPDDPWPLALYSWGMP